MPYIDQPKQTSSAKKLMPEELSRPESSADKVYGYLDTLAGRAEELSEYAESRLESLCTPIGPREKDTPLIEAYYPKYFEILMLRLQRLDNALSQIADTLHRVDL